MINYLLKIFFFALLFLVPGAASAEESAFYLSGESSLAQTLDKHLGKKVTLKLASGVEIKGKVSKVGDLAVRVSELEGQEFFDAWVRLDDISAILVRMK